MVPATKTKPSDSSGNRSQGGAVQSRDRDYAKGIVSTRGWLATVPAAFRDALLLRSRLRTFASGETVYRVGDAPTGIYGVVDGSLWLRLGLGGGDERFVVAARPGFWFGVASAISGRKRMLTVSCASPSVLFHLPLSDFDRLARNPEYLRLLSALAIDNHDIFLNALSDLENRSMSTRIASRLYLKA